MDALSFKLPVFEGPLDLLLHLIEKNKLDIYDIPILEITRQYLEYLKSWDEMNLEIASEFIVMAATLINIKAKRLLPEAEKKDEEEEDDEAELIRRLLIYKQYKEASVSLKGMFQPDRENVFLRNPQTILGEKPIPSPEELLSGISLEDLYELMFLFSMMDCDILEFQECIDLDQEYRVGLYARFHILLLYQIRILGRG